METVGVFFELQWKNPDEQLISPPTSTYCEPGQVSAATLLPFLRQVPSKAHWSGGAHRKHSKERKLRMFTHESPASHRVLTRWPTVGPAAARVCVPSREAPHRPPVPPPPTHPHNVTGFLCVRDPLLWNPSSFLPLVDPLHRGNPLQRQIKTPRQISARTTLSETAAATRGFFLFFFSFA